MNKKPRRLISPTYFNSFILLVITLHFFFPVQTILRFPFTLIGLALIIIGLFINLQAGRTLRKNTITDNFFENPEILVTEGAFRYSRNPMYLGGIIFTFGLAVLLGSLVSFVFPVILFLLLHFLYIPHEEERLKSMFGNEYLDYVKRVRKWI